MKEEKTYEVPEMSLVTLEADDVVCTSGPDTDVPAPNALGL